MLSYIFLLFLPRACPHTPQLIVSVANKPLVSTLKTVVSKRSSTYLVFGLNEYNSKI